MMKRTEKSAAAVKKIQEAGEILAALGVPIVPPTARRAERMALALLALANIQPDGDWSQAAVWEGAGSWALGTKEIVRFWRDRYGDDLSEGSYDYVKRHQLDYLIEAGLVLESAGNPAANKNSSQRRYALKADAADVLRSFGQASWKEAVAARLQDRGSLEERMKRKRNQQRIHVALSDGQYVELAPGVHNDLQREIVEQFLQRFARGARILYLADASNKKLYVDEAKLRELGFYELSHDLLPDVVAYDAQRNWIFLIEAVHTSNPVSFIRHERLKRLTERCVAPRVYVSVFESRQSFRCWITEIDWETEVWIAESPDHVIHFDGEKFLGPHDPDSTGQEPLEPEGN